MSAVGADVRGGLLDAGAALPAAWADARASSLPKQNSIYTDIHRPVVP